MSFDIDPRDKQQRFLICHPESDCLFVVNSEAERDYIIGSEPCCADVTDIEEFEERYRNEQNKQKQEG